METSSNEREFVVCKPIQLNFLGTQTPNIQIFFFFGNKHEIQKKEENSPTSNLHLSLIVKWKQVQMREFVVSKPIQLNFLATQTPKIKNFFFYGNKPETKKKKEKGKFTHLISSLAQL